jgi:NhaC family Na+:H+ antiporter
MNSSQEPGFLRSLTAFGGVIAIVIVGILALGINLHTLLIIATVWAAVHAAVLGLSFDEIKSAMSSGIEKGLGAFFIFFLIGVLVAALIEGGTIGSLIYYGVDVLHPKFFLPAGFVLCGIMSLATGTSWGTIATLGVVLMGIGGAMGVPLPIVAGMVVAGACFGDKGSPVSDTTVLASMSAGTDMYSHIKSMLYTSIPAGIITLVAFLLIGLNYGGQTVSTQDLVELKQHLAKEFVISPVSLLPLLVLLVLSVKRVPAETSMLASVLVAIVLAASIQDRTTVEVLNSLNDGYKAHTGVEKLDSLLSGGGVQSMMWTMSLALLALSLGGLLHRAGFVRVLMSRLLSRIRRTATLMATTIGAGVVANMSMGEAYLSIIFGGQIFKKSYEDHDLEPYLLSRNLEEGATLSTPLIPWTTSGAFITGVLGMSPLEYGPWAILNYLNPLLSIALAYAGFGIFRRVRAGSSDPRVAQTHQETQGYPAGKPESIGQ